MTDICLSNSVSGVIYITVQKKDEYTMINGQEAKSIREWIHKTQTLIHTLKKCLYGGSQSVDIE